jgi:hypothetical protein
LNGRGQPEAAARKVAAARPVPSMKVGTGATTLEQRRASA